MGVFGWNKDDNEPDVRGLKKHRYADAEGYTFYTCPICGGEYLKNLMTKEHGKTMCIECWNRKYG